MSTITEFANELTCNLSQLSVAPQSPFDVRIESTPENDFTDPLRNGFRAEPLGLYEVARRVTANFPKSPRSRSRDQSSGTEQHESYEAAVRHRECQERGEESELSASDRESLESVLNMKTSERADRSEEFHAPEYSDYVSDPNQDMLTLLTT